MRGTDRARHIGNPVCVFAIRIKYLLCLFKTLEASFDEQSPEMINNA